jgi:hypothetical protein
MLRLPVSGFSKFRIILIRLLQYTKSLINQVARFISQLRGEIGFTQSLDRFLHAQFEEHYLDLLADLLNLKVVYHRAVGSHRDALQFTIHIVSSTADRPALQSWCGYGGQNPYSQLESQSEPRGNKL